MALAVVAPAGDGAIRVDDAGVRRARGDVPERSGEAEHRLRGVVVARNCGAQLASVASAEVAGQRGALAAAERRLEYARKVHASEKMLWEEQISPRQDLLRAEQELNEAQIAVQSAREVADKVIEALESGEYGFVLVNFANGDMVGHTAVRDAVIAAVEALDTQVGRVLDAAKAMRKLNRNAKLVRGAGALGALGALGMGGYQMFKGDE